MSDALFDAVVRGDVARILRALNDGADIDAMQAEIPGWRPLHVAIEAIDEENAPLDVLRVLLEHGANVNDWDRCKDSTPVLMAVLRSQPESVRLLLAHGANPDVTGSEGDTAIRWAAAEGDTAMVDILLTHGVQGSIDTAGTGEGTTPLGAAAIRGHVEIVERLLTAGANPDAVDCDGFSAQQRARRTRSRATSALVEQLDVIIERLQTATLEVGSMAERARHKPA